MNRPVNFSGHCKLIVSDVDLTFTTSAKSTHPDNMAAIREAAARGIPFLFATGRSWGGIVHWVEELNLTAPQILNNGATIIQPADEKTLYSSPIDPILAEHAYLRYIDAGFVPIVAAGNKFLADAEEQKTQWTLLRNHERYTLASREEVLELIRSAQVEKLGVICPERTADLAGVTDEIMSAEAKENRRCAYCFTEKGIMVLVSNNTTKLTGIQKVCDIIGCTLADVLSVGDADNDADMLRGTGLGVSVGNGTPLAKESASHIVADNDHAGLAQAIREFAIV